MTAPATPQPPAWLPPDFDSSRWTVILLKPDCVRRGLVEDVLAWIGREVRVVDYRIIQPTEEQVFAHYDDMLPLSRAIRRDVPSELRRIFVGQDTGLALGYGELAAPRVRRLVGPTDPTTGGRNTIRGRYGTDSLAAAMADGRLIDNLIHTSDTVDAVSRDLGIWFTAADLPLLTDAYTTATEPQDAPAASRHPGGTA